MKRFILSMLWMLLFASTMYAQSLSVESTSPADGSASVSLQTTVSFTFNEAVSFDTFNWDYGIGVEPYDKVIIVDSSITNNSRTLNYEVIHEPDTDYIWFILAISAGSEQPVNEPYILTYTTASTIGQRQVSGNVIANIDPTGAATSAKRPNVDIQANPIARVMSKVVMQKLQIQKAAEKTVAKTRNAKDHSIQQDGSGYHHTLAYLLKGNVFGTDTTDSEMASATVVNPDDGSFTIKYVRPGTYWPFAVKYSSQGMDYPADLGFYDIEGDGIPDSVVVEDSNVDGINITLYPYRPFTAGEGLTRARNRARMLEGNPQLKAMYTFESFFSFDDTFEGSSTAALPDVSGASFYWMYYAHSAENNQSYLLMSLPYGVAEVEELLPEDLDLDLSLARDLPDQFIDSDEAIQIAEDNGGAAYRNVMPFTSTFLVELWGGHYYSLYDEDPTPTAPLFWKVKYYNFSIDFETFEFEEDSMVVFIEMENGSVLKKTTTDIEEAPSAPLKTVLGQNYPNPFNPGTTIPFSLKQAGPVKLQVYSVLGQLVATLVDEVRPAGPQQVSWDAGHMSSGVYLYRLETPGYSSVRSLLLMK